MQVKAYVVVQENPEGGDSIIAIRLTMGAAQAIADRTPRARVDRWLASKDPSLTPTDRPLPPASRGGPA